MGGFVSIGRAVHFRARAVTTEEVMSAGTVPSGRLTGGCRRQTPVAMVGQAGTLILFEYLPDEILHPNPYGLL
jgi:hypothetical protein